MRVSVSEVAARDGPARSDSWTRLVSTEPGTGPAVWVQRTGSWRVGSHVRLQSTKHYSNTTDWRLSRLFLSRQSYSNTHVTSQRRYLFLLSLLSNQYLHWNCFLINPLQYQSPEVSEMNEFPPSSVMLSLQTRPVRHFSPFCGSQVVRRVRVNSLAGIMVIMALIGSTTSLPVLLGHDIQTRIYFSSGRPEKLD